MRRVHLVSALAAGVFTTAGFGACAAIHDDTGAAGVSQSSSVAVRTTATPPSERDGYLVDFGDAATLAWSLELGGTGAPHDVSCTTTKGRVFVCTGLTADHQRETEEIEVSPDGSSWVATSTT